MEKDLIGKKVRVVVEIGGSTLTYKGTLKEVNDWISLETKEGVKIINRDYVTLIEPQ